MICFKKSQ